MSKESYDLDDILAEFSAKNTDLSPDPTETARPERPAYAPARTSDKGGNRAKARAEEKKSSAGKSAGTSAAGKELIRRRAPQPAAQRPDKEAAEAPQAPKKTKYIRPASVRELRPFEPWPEDGKEEPKSADSRKEPTPAPAESPKKTLPPVLSAFVSAAFAVVSAAVLAWVLFHVHPASGTAAGGSADTRLKLSESLDVYMNNMASDALGEQSYIKKIYTLRESDTISPVPDPEGFGTTDDIAVIQELIKKAAFLLDGQKVTFDPNANFVPGTPFRYYLDDTILVIAWQEYINERCCTCAEVKLAHGSQIRRKLAEDSYSSSVQLYASDMAKEANAVIAINGDFYAFRELGITAYQRKLYRNNPETVDSCFFTASGDMLFSRAGELMGEGETEKFIEDNDVVFAIAFGPVLVDNGELQYCEHYPIGEIDTEYSRSCIAMTDELHYFLMTINHTDDARPRANINELARFIYSKGVQKAYTLDGGQTSEIIMMGAPINHVDFGAERTVSDIIYFATAIPNEEASQ